MPCDAEEARYTIAQANSRNLDDKGKLLKMISCPAVKVG